MGRGPQFPAHFKYHWVQGQVPCVIGRSNHTENAHYKKIFIAFYLFKAATLFGSWSCLLWIQLVPIKKAQISDSQSEHRWSWSACCPPPPFPASWTRLNGDLVDLLGICQGKKKKKHVLGGKKVNPESRKREAAYNNSLLSLYWALHFTKYIRSSIWFPTTTKNSLRVIYHFPHFTDLESKAYKEKVTWPNPQTKRWDLNSDLTPSLTFKGKLYGK